MTDAADLLEARRLANAATEHFLASPSLEDLVPGVTTARLALGLTRVNGVAAAFFENLSAVLRTVGIPVTLATSAANGSHWQRIHSAERIRALKLTREAGESDAALEKRRAAAARDVTSHRMTEFVESKDGRDCVATDACQFLINALSNHELKSAAAELLLQGEVLAWSAFEGLARDLFEVILNSEPQRINVLLADPAARQRIPARVTIEELAALGFNLTSCLGSLVVTQQDFSDIRSIRALLPALLGGDGTVTSALNERELWALSQRRHLVVHRRGIVDVKYVEATGTTEALGTRIVVSPDDVERDVSVVALAGISILMRACNGAL